jgi:hypothetical protein
LLNGLVLRGTLGNSFLAALRVRFDALAMVAKLVQERLNVL